MGDSGRTSLGTRCILAWLGFLNTKDSSVELHIAPIELNVVLSCLPRLVG
jgi:hypothetical protein